MHESVPGDQFFKALPQASQNPKRTFAKDDLKMPMAWNKGKGMVTQVTKKPCKSQFSKKSCKTKMPSNAVKFA